MNLRLLAEALTLPEVNELSNYLYEMRRRFAIQSAQPLDYAEKLLCDYGYHIEAIKLHKARLGVGLLEAKIAIDVYKGTV